MTNTDTQTYIKTVAYKFYNRQSLQTLMNADKHNKLLENVTKLKQIW